MYQPQPAMLHYADLPPIQVYDDELFPWLADLEAATDTTRDELLAVPSHCTFRVGNETREWRYGKAFVFDDTIEHEARNDSDQLRVLLIFDIWNPFLAPAERHLVAGPVNAVRDYYRAEGQARRS